jgi:S-adenosyl-L-methionine hydrolase (adenosine-forming)
MKARSPIVTLMTDFGTRDGYVGAMKGVILAGCPEATIVDLTHEVPAHDIAAAAFALAQAAPNFPDGTIHVAVVDPGVGGKRHGVVVPGPGARQTFVGPDNGVFSLVAPAAKTGWEIAAAGFRRQTVSATFHGRDVFAPAAARLAAGARPEEAGPPVKLEGTLGPRPILFSHGGTQVTGHVIHVDRFGNLVTNIPAAALPADPVVRIGSVEIRRISITYEEVPRGQTLAYVGSSDCLEVGVRDGSAMDVLAQGRGAAVVVVGTRVAPP